MKISGDKLNGLVGTTDAATTVAPAAGSNSSRAAGPATRKDDQLTLSPQAQLLRTAAEAVADAPDVRPDVVAKMRALLDRGELGKDAAKVADAIIDTSIDGL